MKARISLSLTRHPDGTRNVRISMLSVRVAPTSVPSHALQSGYLFDEMTPEQALEFAKRIVDMAQPLVPLPSMQAYAQAQADGTTVGHEWDKANAH